MKASLTCATSPRRKLIDYTQRRTSEPQEQELCAHSLETIASISLFSRGGLQTRRVRETVSDTTPFMNNSFRSIASSELMFDDVEFEHNVEDNEMVDFFLKIPSRDSRSRVSTSSDLREQFDRHGGKSASIKKHSFIQAILSEPPMRSRRTQRRHKQRLQ